MCKVFRPIDLVHLPVSFAWCAALFAPHRHPAQQARQEAFEDNDAKLSPHGVSETASTPTYEADNRSKFEVDSSRQFEADSLPKHEAGSGQKLKSPLRQSIAIDQSRPTALRLQASCVANATRLTRPRSMPDIDQYWKLERR